MALRTDFTAIDPGTRDVAKFYGIDALEHAQAINKAPSAAAAYVAASESTASSTYTDLTTTTDTITLIIGASKTAKIDISAALLDATVPSTFIYVGFALSGANTLAASDVLALQISNNDGLHGPVRYASFLLTPNVLTATGSTVVKLKYRVTGGTLGAEKRSLAGIAYP